MESRLLSTHTTHIVTAGTNNWAKYLAVPLLPTTLFFHGAALFPTESNISQNEEIQLYQIISFPPKR